MAKSAIKYLSNVAKSAKYASVAAIKDLNPVVSDLIETNADFARSTYDTMKNLKKNMNKAQVKQSSGQSMIGKLAMDYKRNLIADLKSGNFYNKERESASYSMNDDDAFGDFDFDVSTDFDEDSSSSFDIKESLDNTGSKIADAVNSMSFRTAEYQAEVTKQSTAQMLLHQTAMFNQLHQDISMVNTNVAGMVKFNNQIMKTHVENSKTFYETQQRQMNEQTAILKEMLDIQKAVFMPKNKSMTRKVKATDIFTSEGVINLGEYLNYIRQNSGMGGGDGSSGLKETIKSLAEMGGDSFTSNPLGGLMTSLIKMMIPKSAKNSMTRFNNTLSGAFSTALLKMTKSSRNSFNLLPMLLGEMFGIKAPKSKIYTGGYNKDAVAWNGKNSKALNEVIPTLLSKIYSAVSGQPELRYDYNTGTFKNAKQIKSEFKYRQNRAISDANYSVRDELNTQISRVRFSSTKQKNDFLKAVEKIMGKNFKNMEYFDPKDVHDARFYGLNGQDADMFLKLFTKMYSRVSKSNQMKASHDLIKSRDEFARFLRTQEESGDSIFNMLFDGSISGKKGKSSSKTKGGPLFVVSEKLDITNSLLSQILSTLQTGRGGRRRRGGAPSGGPGPIPKAPSSSGKSSKDYEKMSKQYIKDLDAAYKSGRMSRKAYLKQKKIIQDEIKAYKESRSNIGLNASQASDAMSIDDYLNLADDEFEYREGVSDILQGMTTGATASERIKSFLSGVKSLAQQPIQFLGNVMGTVDKRLYNMLFGTKKDGQQQSISQRIIQGFDNVFDTISDTFKRKFHDIKDSAKSAGNKALDFLNDAFDLDIRKFIGNFKQSVFGDRETSFAAGMTKAIKTGFSNMFKGVAEMFTGDDSFFTKYVFGRKNKKGKDKAKQNKAWDDFARDTRRTARDNSRSDGTGETEPIGNAATGIRRVKRTGVVAVSEGEMIVPQDMNPFNIRGRYRAENSAKRKYMKAYGNQYIGSYAEGGSVNFDYAKEKIDNLTNSFRAGKVTFTGLVRRIKKILEKYPEVSQYASQVINSLRKEKRQKLDETDYEYSKDENGNVKEDYRPLTMKIKELLSGLMDNIAGSEFANKVKGKIGGKGSSGVSGKDVIEDTLSNFKDYLPNIAGGGVAGLGLSLMLGLAGGPLLGAAVGSGLGLLSKSNKLQTMLFGNKIKDDKGNVTHDASGVLSKEIVSKIDKYFPNMKKGSIIGTIAGLLPITPFGPLTGIMLGSAIGFAKSNDELSQTLFGDGTTLKKAKDYIGKKLPRVATGAGAAAVMGLVNLSPFGLVTNLAIGSALGMVSDTEQFKDSIYGQKDSHGNRHGGLVGFVKGALEIPIKQLTGTIDYFKKGLEKRVFTPLMDLARPLTQSLHNLGDFIKDKFSSAINEHIVKPVGERINKYFVKPIEKIILTPLKGLAKGAFRFATMPFTIAGAAGRRWSRKQLGTVGTRGGETAAERNRKRLQLASRYGDNSLKRREILNSKSAKIDLALQKMNVEDLRILRAASFGYEGSSKKAVRAHAAGFGLKALHGQTLSSRLTALVSRRLPDGSKFMQTQEMSAILDYVYKGKEKQAVCMVEALRPFVDDDQEIDELVAAIKEAVQLRKEAETARQNYKSISRKYKRLGIDLNQRGVRSAIKNEYDAANGKKEAEPDHREEFANLDNSMISNNVKDIKDILISVRSSLFKLAFPTSAEAIAETRRVEGTRAAKAAEDNAQRNVENALNFDAKMKAKRQSQARQKEIHENFLKRKAKINKKKAKAENDIVTENGPIDVIIDNQGNKIPNEQDAKTRETLQNAESSRKTQRGILGKLSSIAGNVKSLINPEDPNAGEKNHIKSLKSVFGMLTSPLKLLGMVKGGLSGLGGALLGKAAKFLPLILGGLGITTLLGHQTGVDEDGNPIYVHDYLDKAFAGIKSGISNAADAAKGLPSAAGEALTSLPEKIGNKIGQIWYGTGEDGDNGLKGWLEDKWNTIKNDFKEGSSWLGGVASSFATAIGPTLMGAVQYVVGEGVPFLIKSLLEWAPAMLSTVVSGTKNAILKIPEIMTKGEVEPDHPKTASEFNYSPRSMRDYIKAYENGGSGLSLSIDGGAGSIIDNAGANLPTPKQLADSLDLKQVNEDEDIVSEIEAGAESSRLSPIEKLARGLNTLYRTKGKAGGALKLLQAVQTKGWSALDDLSGHFGILGLPVKAYAKVKKFTSSASATLLNKVRDSLKNNAADVASTAIKTKKTAAQKLADKAKNTVNKVKNKIAGKTSGMVDDTVSEVVENGTEQAQEKVVETIEKTITGGEEVVDSVDKMAKHPTLKKLVDTVRGFFKDSKVTKWFNRALKALNYPSELLDRIGKKGASELGEKFLEKLAKAAAEGGQTFTNKLVGNIAAKTTEFFGTGGLATVGELVSDFFDGYLSAEGALEVREPKPMERFMTGIANIFTEYALIGLVSDHTVVGWVTWAMESIGIDLSDLRQRQQQLKYAVQTYCELNGVDLTVYDYLMLDENDYTFNGIVGQTWDATGGRLLNGILSLKSKITGNKEAASDYANAMKYGLPVSKYRTRYKDQYTLPNSGVTLNQKETRAYVENAAKLHFDLTGNNEFSLDNLSEEEAKLYEQDYFKDELTKIMTGKTTPESKDTENNAYTQQELDAMGFNPILYGLWRASQGATYWDESSNSLKAYSGYDPKNSYYQDYETEIKLAELTTQWLKASGNDKNTTAKKILEIYQKAVKKAAKDNMYPIYDIRDYLVNWGFDESLLKAIDDDPKTDINKLLGISGSGSRLFRFSAKGSGIGLSGRAANIKGTYSSYIPQGYSMQNLPYALGTKATTVRGIQDEFETAAEAPSTVFNKIQSIWTSASKAINADILNMPRVLSAGMNALNRFLAVSFGFAAPDDDNINFAKIVTDQAYLDTRARYISENSPFYSLFAGISGTNTNNKRVQQQAQSITGSNIAKTVNATDVADSEYVTSSSNVASIGTSSSGTTTGSSSKSSKSSSVIGSIVSGVKSGVSTAVKAVKNFFGFGAKGSGVSDQSVTPGDAGDPSEISFVSQKYSPYARKPFSVSGDTKRYTIADAGCAPAVASMVINNLNTSASPISMEEAMRTAVKYKVPNGGVTADYFVDQFKSHGLNAAFISAGSPKKKQTIVNYLKNGTPVILMGSDPNNTSKSRSPFGPNDHYVVATKISNDGKTIYVNDPESNRANIPYKLDAIMSRVKLGVIPIEPNGKRASAGLMNKVKKVLHQFTANAVGQIVYVGDSRTVGMKSAVGESKSVHFIGKTSEGLSWLRSTALKQVKSYLKSNPNAIVIYNFGVNDLGNINDYIKFYKQNAGISKNIWYMSVNPVDESVAKQHGYSVTNASIKSFNEKYKSFAGNRYIDTYNGIGESSFGTSDGVHYNSSTYQKIHNFCTSAVAGQAMASSASSVDSTGGSTQTATTGGAIDWSNPPSIDEICENIHGISDLLRIFSDVGSVYGLSDSGSTQYGDSSGGLDTDSADSSTINSIDGPVSSDPEVAKQQKAIVAKMQSLVGTLTYAQGNAKYPGSRNPEDGSGDCSSTTQYVYKKVTGVDIGSCSGEQIKNSNTYAVDSPHNGDSWTENKLQLGDLLLYGQNGQNDPGGHSEIYIGNGKVLSHGDSSRKGPNEATLQRHGYKWEAKRLNSFKGSTKKSNKSGSFNKAAAKGSGLLARLVGRGSGLLGLSGFGKSTANITQQQWLTALASWVYMMESTGKWIYGNTSKNYAQNMKTSVKDLKGKKGNHLVNCASFVSFVLQWTGVTSAKDGDQIYCNSSGGLTFCEGSKRYQFGSGSGAEQRFKAAGTFKHYNDASSTNIDLMPGDICFYTHHTNVYMGKNSKGQQTWYDAGRSGTYDAGTSMKGHWTSFAQVGTRSGIKHTYRINYNGGVADIKSQITKSAWKTPMTLYNGSLPSGSTTTAYQGAISGSSGGANTTGGTTASGEMNAANMFDAFTNLATAWGLSSGSSESTATGTTDTSSYVSSSAGMPSDVADSTSSSNSGSKQDIWNYFKKKKIPDKGIAGLMGNLRAESGYKFNNLQDTANTKLGDSDEEYTKKIDNGTYSKNDFLSGSHQGYGLAQWTYHTRKSALYDLVKSRNVSIADPNAQLDYLWQELNSSYPSVLNAMKAGNSIQEVSNRALHDFENPSSQGPDVERLRASYGQEAYNEFHGKSSGLINTSGKGFVSQLDPRYNGMKVGHESVAQAGCAPAVASMINGGSMASNAKVANGYLASDGGVKAKYFVDQFNQSGGSSVSTNSSDIQKSIKSGRSTVILGRDSSNKSKANSPFGPNNHYVLATGMSKDGKYTYINDPESNTPNKRYLTSAIKKGMKLGISGRGSGLAGLNMSGKGSDAGVGSKTVGPFMNWIRCIQSWINHMESDGEWRYFNDHNWSDPDDAEKPGPYTKRTNCALMVVHVLHKFGVYSGSDKFWGTGEGTIAWRGTNGEKHLKDASTIIRTPSHDKLKAGDIVTFWGHTAIFMGKNKAGKETWYSAGRDTGVNVGQTGTKWKSFALTSNRYFGNISYIIRLNYSDPQAPDSYISPIDEHGYITPGAEYSSAAYGDVDATGQNGYSTTNMYDAYTNLAAAWGLSSGTSSASASPAEDPDGVTEEIPDGTSDGGSSSSSGASSNTSDMPTATKQQIHDWLLKKGLTKAGAAAVMGNWQEESGFQTNNLENIAEPYAGSDSAYTKKVDNAKGDAKKELFLNPVGSRKLGDNYQPGHAGYGLAQWTQPDSRKEGLLNLVNSRNVSISDAGSQLDWFWTELNQPTYAESLKAVTQSGMSVEDAASKFMKNFEGINHPSESARMSHARNIYNEFGGGNSGLLRRSGKASAVTPEFNYNKTSTQLQSSRSGNTTNVRVNNTTTKNSDSTNKLIQVVIELLSKVVDNTMSIKDIASLVLKLTEMGGLSGDSLDTRKTASEAKLLALNAMKQSQQSNTDDALANLIKSVEAIAAQ